MNRPRTTRVYCTEYYERQSTYVSPPGSSQSSLLATLIILGTGLNMAIFIPVAHGSILLWQQHARTNRLIRVPRTVDLPALEHPERRAGSTALHRVKHEAKAESSCSPEHASDGSEIDVSVS